MENSALTKELRNLLDETKALLDAVNNRDNLEVGRILSKRKLTLDNLESIGGLGKEPDDEQKRLSSQIVKLDNQFMSKLKKLSKECGDSVENVRKRSAVFQKYNADLLRVESQRYLDKKR